jgi:transporter family-2 protein
VIWFVLTAFVGGVLVSVSRQLNGRLALSTSAMMASFWNHVVGLVILSGLGLAGGIVLTPDLSGVPLWSLFGGPVGVIFVASGSWLIARIGATRTALLVIGGQMVAGVLIDRLMGAERGLFTDLAGVALILAGVALIALRRG